MTAPSLESAIDLAREYLLAEAATGFAETLHVMEFPRRAGFRVRTERQSSDIFARAVLGAILADLARTDTGHAPAWQDLARREADYVAAARLQDRRGGWSYFPGLPELPPDLDSLSAALQLFAHAAPEHLALCAEPVEIALANMDGRGAITTWLISPDDTPASRAVMVKGVRHYWGQDAAVEVCARFALALHSAARAGWSPPRGAARTSDALGSLTGFVASRQGADGLWEASWYLGRAYPTVLCRNALASIGQHSAAADRALTSLLASQREDGGWGYWESVPVDTSVAMKAIVAAGGTTTAGSSHAIRRALAWLLDHQALKGCWNAGPWIRMEVGRPSTRITHTLSYGSVTLATAFALDALLEAASPSQAHTDP